MPNSTNPTRVPLIMWGSMPLMTVSTTVITVLHSAEVVNIPHESWSSLIAGYPLYRRVPLHTSRVCAKISLQGCSMVSPSLQCTRWGFTGGVSPDHQRPPSCAMWFSGESTPLPTHSHPDGSQESPLNPHHRLIRQTRFYHILHQAVPI
jgi:hypothetical protein